MDLPALEVKQPVIDPMAASQVSRAADTQNRSEVLKQTAANLEMLASGMAHAMPEGPDGPLDEAKLEEVLGSYGAAGMDPAMLAKIQDNPNAARVIYRASAAALKSARDEKLFPLELQRAQAEIAAEMAKANAGPDLNNDQENLAQINAERQAAGQQAMSMEEYLAAKKGGGLQVVTNPDGTTTVTMGGPGKLTEVQSKDIGFYTRGSQANEGLKGLETELTDWGQAHADMAPLGLGNALRKPEFRQAKVEADNFLSAILRKDSGAAITDKEFDLYGPMFLPVPFDDPATIKLKRQKRATALMAIRSGLGTAEAIAAANEEALDLDLPNDEAAGVGSGDAPADDLSGMSDDELLKQLGL